MSNEPPKQHGINSSAEAHFAVDLDDRYALVKALAKRLIAVDVHDRRV
jgi:hypothetical protein